MSFSVFANAAFLVIRSWIMLAISSSEVLGGPFVYSILRDLKGSASAADMNPDHPCMSCDMKGLHLYPATSITTSIINQEDKVEVTNIPWGLRNVSLSGSKWPLKEGNGEL